MRNGFIAAYKSLQLVQNSGAEVIVLNCAAEYLDFDSCIDYGFTDGFIKVLFSWPAGFIIGRN
jgi:hypothetical protein